MPTNILIYIILTPLSFVFTSSVHAVEYVPQIAEVVRVIDGDTFWIRFPDNDEDPSIEYVANLMGVDAPGRGEADCEAPGITSITTSLLLGKKIWIEWDSHDRITADGRLLVYVTKIDDRSADLNALYIEQGWGWVPRRFPADRKQKYLALEKRAKTNKKGLWGGACAPNGLDTIE